MTEEIIQVTATDVKHGEIVRSSATYCMVCQNIVYAAYILDHGVYHCPSCVSSKEINAITRAKRRREGRGTPDDRALQEEYASFRTVALSDEDNKTSKIVRCKTIGCEHGNWNDEKTVWKWNEKWVCNLCEWSCDDSTYQDVVNNKKGHENMHKEKWDKLLASKKEGQTAPKVAWVLKENRKDD